MTYRKKLIEVALPLDAINEASAREKSIRHGHPSTLHLWWARRPLAACRAVIFSSLVDDPSAHPEQFPSEEAQTAERERLFGIIRELVVWENNTNSTVLDAARAEILRSTDSNPPSLLDPFCGGGSIPLEAQRLGLEAHGSDLNPVAVLITKALIEIPPKFAGCPPINTESRKRIAASNHWAGVHGLVEDVRYYGAWMRGEAQRRIGHLYPKVALQKEYGGGEATAIAWLWARTVGCPNPACGAQTPLVRSFWLSTKAGKKVWIEPIVDRLARTVRFEVRTGHGAPPEGTVSRRGAVCICCNTSVSLDYVRAEGRAKRISAQMTAIVAEGQRGRLYSSPTHEQEEIAAQAQPAWVPETDLPDQALGFRVQLYGMTRHQDLFTPRQLVALTTLSDMVSEARDCARRDAVAAGLADDNIPLAANGIGAMAYADAIATYLASAIDRVAMSVNSLARWNPVGAKIQHCFGRQALSMIWDFADANVLFTSTGSWEAAIEMTVNSLSEMSGAVRADVVQRDAAMPITDVGSPIISTDPPYYDNIGYADLSDFFYVWLRHSLIKIYPDVFSTLLVPKVQELIAAPYRFGGDKSKAETHFEEGLGQAFGNMRAIQNQDYPLTVYYAFRQVESDEDDGDDLGGDGATVASTGWETMLEALLKANFTITGTWPMRTEMKTRQRAMDSNALASSIVLVCRPRPANAPLTTRREFLNALKRELPDALKNLQHGNIAPVDLAQATIGPGMAIYSRYSKVLEVDGTAMRVRTALQLINQALDQILAEQEGEFDADTRWALAWFEQFGSQEGPFGIAETLSKAKNTSIAGLAEAGLLSSKAGKVRLLSRDELSPTWSPTADKRLTIWEVAQHLMHALEQTGESGAAALYGQVGEMADIARDLAYRIYTICERKGWAEEALAYNSLVISWSQITQLASKQVDTTLRQQKLLI